MPRFLCLFALLAFASGADEDKIEDNYFNKLPWRPIEIGTPDYEKFEQTYREALQKEPETIEKSLDFRVVRLEKTDIPALTDSGLELPAERAMPFRYYDESYGPRLKRGYESLRDLTSGYKDDLLNEKLLKAVARRFPKLVQYHVLGKTRLGRNIPAVKIAGPGAKKHRVAILFKGSHHASEMTSTEHCYQLLYDLLSKPKKYAKILENHVVWIVPLVNPDGAYFFWNVSTSMGRKNGYLATMQEPESLNRGVDLNRNYPFKWNSGNRKASSGDPDNFYYRGPRAGSEPETRALMKLARTERFVYAMSFHSKASRILYPYTIDDTENPTPDLAQEFARKLAQKVDTSELPRGFKAAKNLYSVDGTDQDYYYHTYGTLAYILETSYENCRYSQVGPYIEKYVALTDALLFDYSRKKKFALRIVDQKNKPVRAKIQFSDQEFFERETRHANAKTGSFVRVTNSNEKVTVTISAKGFKTRRISLAPQSSAFPALRTITLRK